MLDDDMLTEGEPESPWQVLHLIWMLPTMAVLAIPAIVAVILLVLLFLSPIAVFVYIILLAFGLV